MSGLADRRGTEDGAGQLCTPSQAEALYGELAPGWEITEGGKALRKAFRFADFHRTMSFVNALAHEANREDHHPDLEVGYNYCNVRFSTHDAGGLTLKDFIGAARADRLT
ncbi:MAG: 4a-hydroxytetrahydrobiopterin dehydratase [Steroidobacteraceae bacterium]